MAKTHAHKIMRICAFCFVYFVVVYVILCSFVYSFTWLVLFDRVSVRLFGFVCLSLRLFVRAFNYDRPLVCRSVCLSVRWFVDQSVYLSVGL